MTIQIVLPNKEEFYRVFPEPVSVHDLALEYQDQCPNPILTCRINHKDASLNSVLEHDALLELCDLTNPSTNMSYQLSLTIVYQKAAHDVLGKDLTVSVWNSLNKGLYTTIRPGFWSEEQIESIKNRMQELIDQDLPFQEREIDQEELKTLPNTSQQDLSHYSLDLEKAIYVTLEDESSIVFHHLLPSTGYLKSFELMKYRNGLLLRVPHPHLSPNIIMPYKDQDLLYSAYSEAKRWGKITHIRFASDLNQAIRNQTDKDLVLLSEALHEKKIAEIAQQIYDEKKRIILIAGPSSSGKTTFANRLIIQLRVLGLRPLYLGMDDYFVEREETPLLPNGEYDYENITALDLHLMDSNINDLLQGKKVDLPTYDFKEGKKVFGNRITSLEEGQPIIMEGIHGLNPELSKDLPEEEKFKIYISPLTQINVDHINRIPTTDARMLRRMVRDYQFRGYSASETIHKWPAVRQGEEQYIFPYSTNADVFFNSHLTYELSAIKTIAEPLLKQITPDSDTYPEAQRLLEFLDFFVSMPDTSIIPNNSIMREFLGGSVLVQ